MIEYDFKLPEQKVIPPHPEGLPAHLGGHEHETHIDEGAADYLIKTLNINSVCDVGCGPAGMVEVFLNKGLKVVGIDGDSFVERPTQTHDKIIIHDYATGPYKLLETYDLGWCVEFVEHVDVDYMPNFIETFKKCRYVAMTHALPGQPGHHHVNCKPFEYWLGVMEYNGFTIMVEETNEMRKQSTMKERYIRQQGYLFKNGRI